MNYQIADNVLNVLANVTNVFITEKPKLNTKVNTVYLVPETESIYHSVNVQKDSGIQVVNVNNVHLHVPCVPITKLVKNVKSITSYMKISVFQNAQLVSGVIPPTENANHVTKLVKLVLKEEMNPVYLVILHISYMKENVLKDVQMNSTSVVLVDLVNHVNPHVTLVTDQVTENVMNVSTVGTS
jgi:hypothetical protein